MNACEYNFFPDILWIQVVSFSFHLTIVTYWKTLGRSFSKWRDYIIKRKGQLILPDFLRYKTILSTLAIQILPH